MVRGHSDFVTDARMPFGRGEFTREGGEEKDEFRRLIVS